MDVIFFFLYLFILKTLNSNLRLKNLTEGRISIGRLLFGIFILTPLIVAPIIIPLIIVCLLMYFAPGRVCCVSYFGLGSIWGPVANITIGIVCGLIWIIWSENGFFANLNVFGKDKRFWNPVFASCSKSSTLLKLFVSGSLVWFVLWYLYEFGSWALREVFRFSMSFEDFEFLRTIYLLILVHSLWLFIPPIVAGMLVYGLSKLGLSLKEYITRLILPIGLSAVFVGGGLFVYQVAVNEYDYTKEFHKELRIPKIEPKEMRILIFTEGKVKMQIEKAGFNLISEGDHLDTSKEYLGRVKDYLRAKNYRTTFTEKGADYVIMGYNQNWLFPEAFWFRLNLLENGSLWAGVPLLGCLWRYAEYKPRLLEIADRLADEKFFYHGSRGSKLLGNVYLRFGDYKKAQYWYDKAEELGYENGQRPIPEIDSQKPFLKNGIIKGRVLINEESIEGIKVGLFWCHPKVDIEGIEIKLNTLLISI